MNVSDLAKMLSALGCPPSKAAEMASQLDKRARQLAEQKKRSYEDALAHLLSLLQQGWAAQGTAAVVIPTPEAAAFVAVPKPPVSTQAGIRPWPTSHSETVGDYRIFSVRADAKSSPRTGQTHDFYVIDCHNWVNVIALTPGNELILVEQFRHGSGTVELEVPGGVIDPEDASPESAAGRELREETGYEGQEGRIIGRCFPNPAIMSNTCFTVLVRNCSLQHPVDFDQAEDIATRLVPVAELPDLIAAGTIQHSLVLAAFSHFIHHK